MKTAPPYGHEEWFRIRTHEIDHHKKITVPSLQMLMQEASMQNVIKLKLSVWDLEQHQISWVLLRKELKVYRLPRLGERIKVITYPAGFDRVFAFRDFWVYSESDEVLAHAASTWTLLNLATRKLQRIPQEMLDMNLISPEDRLQPPDSKIDVPQDFTNAYSYDINNFDLDWNSHVNNVVLSKLMLQSFEHDFHNEHKLQRFTFHIKNECYLGERVRIDHEEDDDVNYHRILGHDNRVVAIGQSVWI